MFFVIEGQGELRFGDALHPIRAGDIIACPPGGPETAHHIVNTSEADLKFLAVSTRLSPEVCEYPDTGRFGLLAEMPGAADGKPRELRFMGRAGESLEYWQGERCAGAPGKGELREWRRVDDGRPPVLSLRDGRLVQMARAHHASSRGVWLKIKEGAARRR
jgi:hypothetical protein